VTIEGSNSFFLSVLYDQKFCLVELKNPKQIKQLKLFDYENNITILGAIEVFKHSTFATITTKFH
jgi:hypothetical protein